jgi:TDG/mug DNA glycosylase family protein
MPEMLPPATDNHAVPKGASTSLLRVPAPRVPLALAELHRTTAVGATVAVTVSTKRWTAHRLEDIIDGAGFAAAACDERDAAFHIRATRLRTLPDYVGPGMQLLFVGLNPSIYAADAGVGFARPGNRFWPAALAAGIVARDRDPRDALRNHAVGFTDLVKRATARADELQRDEYRAGVERVRRLVEWLAPRVVCAVGFAGWRAAVDARAQAGWQAESFGHRPVYVMPNTSGLNARVPLATFVTHLQNASTGPDAG